MRHYFELHPCSCQHHSNVSSVAKPKKDGAMMAKVRYLHFEKSLTLQYLLLLPAKSLLVKGWPAFAVKKLFHFLLPEQMQKIEE